MFFGSSQEAKKTLLTIDTPEDHYIEEAEEV